MSNKKTLIEVCCASVDDAVEAARGGAGRVELNSALFLGGLTPSLGTLQEVKQRVDIPVLVMIRPRGGGFCYTETEMAVMLRDTQLAIEHGADGIVFGILHKDGTIDRERCAQLMQCCANGPAVFHRAFDVVPEPFTALDQLVDLGFKRILTSGQARSVPEGLDLIKELVLRAGKRIEILPGAGIRAHNVRTIVERTGVNQVHLSAFRTQHDSSVQHGPHIHFGGALHPPEDQYGIIDHQVIQCTSEQLHGP
jgi:copper homeostasis protein